MYNRPWLVINLTYKIYSTINSNHYQLRITII
ncbi:hypothetical protein VP501E541_P0223 [Vibrio phage 501E54-1]|nr:hypothetical protein VP501E541_P0223 [Vibrio phage 501E54-1]